MRILAVSAHPHYPEIFCAGTIYNHAQRGDEAYVVALSVGGTDDQPRLAAGTGQD